MFRPFRHASVETGKTAPATAATAVTAAAAAAAAVKQEADLAGYLASSSNIASLLTAHVFRVIEGLALLSRPVARSISIDFSQLSACRALR